MKRIKSIYMIFVVFLFTVIACFAILYRYSTSSLEDSLMRVAKIQMEYSGSLLEQKIKEIEIEADGILNSDDLKTLHLCITDRYDVYDYVMAVKSMKAYLGSRQKSNVGMAEFRLYWPRSGRLISTLYVDMDETLMGMLEDNQWLIYENEAYFVRRYKTDWDILDDEPYLIIKVERDYLYKIKSMALGLGSGGTILTYGDDVNFFSGSELEKELLKERAEAQNTAAFYEVKTSSGRYQMIESDTMKNGLKLISYYPLRIMRKSVVNITRITGISLCIALAVGFIFMSLYDKHIILQMGLLTEKLKQLENGNLSAKISHLPNSEFSYVFEQFNRMVDRIRQLIDSTVREQQLRSRAELEQLQLQINPHFLYNSLSYIVAMANKPQAVTQMAVHLANYYRYCTKSKSIATIGEEVFYAKAYLSVMAMRKNIEYTIDVSKELNEVKMIPLILQPIIENAIEHGIEGRENAKRILLKIYALPSGAVRFEVSDDGEGMSDSELEQLTCRLQKKYRNENESVGLWNVNQRLLNYYDTSAGLRFSESIWGGMTVSFTILPEEKKNGSIDCG